MSTRIHPSLPAPVIHAGFSIPQSKSHVLAGVQDAYWSDDEEDPECPLCSEEMDVSDVNFKPCVCGYQICRFCWHHIKENLNKRCPACRRLYTDEAVEFKPIDKEVLKRLTQQKKQRERERKELDAVGRRHLANVRVVQRNVVYVVGIGPRFAKEELIPTLRSTEFFGQYGKINKILLTKRTSPGGEPVVGLYITFNRREDAARCIAAVDGTASQGGGRDEVMRASYGTTKYCMTFLRGSNCNDHGCMNLHEWGDEKDCFTKEDLATLKHTIKATETRSRNIVSHKKGEEPEGLPRNAQWAQKPIIPPSPSPAASTSTSILASNGPSITAARATRRTGLRPQTKEPKPTKPDRKATKASTSSLPSRPSTPASLPARPATPVEIKPVPKPKEKEVPVPVSNSPAPSATAESEVGSNREVTSPAPTTDISQVPSPAVRSPAIPPAVPTIPPGLPAIPPGLTGPPGIPMPSRPPRPDTASPQTPLLASQTSYQMSNAARALLDDVTSRRQNNPPADSTFSPFPDFDRTLEMLASGGDEFGGFSFNLDPKLVSQVEAAIDEELPPPSFDISSPPGLAPFRGSFLDTFPALRAPPGINSQPSPRPRFEPAVASAMDRQGSTGSNYTGSFNPFSDDGNDAHRRLDPSLGEDAHQMSRFGFARGRQSSAASSPLNLSSLSLNNYGPDSHPLYNPPSESTYNSWGGANNYHQHQTTSRMSSPLVHHSQTNPLYALQHQQQQQQSSRFQPFDTPVSEAQLRDFIQHSRDQATNRNGLPQKYTTSQQQHFTDPAIMSARFASPIFSSNQHMMEPPIQSHIPYGPPPGIFPQHIPASGVDVNVSSMPPSVRPVSIDTSVASPPEQSPAHLSPTEFPALGAPTTESVNDLAPTSSSPTTEHKPLSPTSAKAQEKAERRAAKKAAAAERAAERQKIAREKAAAKAAEKAEKTRLALEKEKAAAEKLAEEKAAKEKAVAEKSEALRKEKEAAEKERAARLEREKAVQAEKQTTVATKKTAAATKAKEPPANKQPVTKSPAVEPQAALLSKKPKKNKTVAPKVPRVSKEDEQGRASPVLSASTSDIHHTRSSNTANSSSNNSRSQSLDRNSLRKETTSLTELLEEIEILNPAMDLLKHSFFDLQKLNPAAKMPLEYGPLVHALSALSVGGGTFANNLPSGSIDNAVSSFQQLLETLTQTISDLLRLLPRTTWDDSSSFDGVLRDMLKGDDFLDEGGEDGIPGKEDEVAALTLALERRARWMEVQLSKLEELHRDINTAAVRAVLSFNDSGWDKQGFLPRSGNTLKRFENIGIVEEDGRGRPMTVEELERKLAVAQEAAVFAESEMKEAMQRMVDMRIKPMGLD